MIVQIVNFQKWRALLRYHQLLIAIAWLLVQSALDKWVKPSFDNIESFQ